MFFPPKIKRTGAEFDLVFQSSFHCLLPPAWFCRPSSVIHNNVQLDIFAQLNESRFEVRPLCKERLHVRMEMLSGGRYFLKEWIWNTDDVFLHGWLIPKLVPSFFTAFLYCFCVFLLLWAVNSPIFGCCLCIFFWDCVRSVLKGVRRDFCLVFCFWVAVLTLWGLQPKKHFPLFDLNMQTGLGRTGNDQEIFLS